MSSPRGWGDNLDQMRFEDDAELRRRYVRAVVGLLIVIALGVCGWAGWRFLRSRLTRLLDGAARSALIATSIGVAAMVVAMALMTDPSLLIADEPTTALDVTIQAQITELVADLQRRLGMAIIWITHDLGVVAGSCDRALVMRRGRLVETAAVTDLFRAPQAPYTAELIAASRGVGA